MTSMRRVASSLLLASAATAPLPAAALDIDGLQPLAQLTLQDANGMARQQRMEIRHSHGKLTIEPWPGFLPARLIDQHIVAERQLWPGGPSDLVTFTRAGAQQPWIMLGNHSRRGTPIAGDWHLQQIEGDWVVTDGVQKKRLKTHGHRSAPIIQAGALRWRVHLLDATTDPASATPTAEREPRISWVAVRQSRN